MTARASVAIFSTPLAERSPMRRADLKVVMELVLEEMGKMLDAGDELVLPPLGKLSVKKRVAKRGGGDMLTVKLRRIPGAPRDKGRRRVVLTIPQRGRHRPLRSARGMAKPRGPGG
jgi:nucleoid DNA-binding protein